MTIERKYQPQAQRASDLLYTAIIAVEECGADEALTAIVIALGDQKRNLQRLFELDPSLVKDVRYPAQVIPLGLDGGYPFGPVTEDDVVGQAFVKAWNKGAQSVGGEMKGSRR